MVSPCDHVTTFINVAQYRNIDTDPRGAIVMIFCAGRQVEDQKEDMTTLQERQRDLFETIKSLEKDIQVRYSCYNDNITINDSKKLF